MPLLSELSRRNVFRVAVAYLAAAWFLVQVAETLFPIFGLSDTAVRAVVIALAVGFVPAVVLSWVFQLTPDGLKLDADVAPGADRTSTRALDRIIIVMLVLAVGYFAIDKFVIDPARDAAAIEAARLEGRSDAVVDAYGDKSIIVLPFVNMSDDTAQEYFSDGLTEELLNLLARLPDLRVISRSTAFTFKRADIPIVDIARKVDVAHVLEGSVRRSGDTIRVTAQLIDAHTDTQLWSETYDRTLDDIFVIQDDIAGRVVDELEMRFLGVSPSAERIDPRAYDLYLQARHILNQSDYGTTRQAEAILVKALEIEPNYVDAIGELARTYFHVATHDAALHDSYIEKRDALVSRMAEVAPDHPATNAWLGWLALSEHKDARAAAPYLERSLEGDPKNSLHLGAARKLFEVLGRHDEAIAIGKYLVDRDPACAVCVYTLAQTYRDAGRHREAAQVLESILEWRTPDSRLAWYTGVSWLVAGEPGRALQWFARYRDSADKDNANDLGYLMALHDLGRHDEFEREFATLRQDSTRSSFEGIARIYAWVGDTDKAFEHLELALAQDPEFADLIDTDLYEKIKSDPRWNELRARYGVVDIPVENVDFDPPLPQEILRSLEAQQGA